MLPFSRLFPIAAVCVLALPAASQELTLADALVRAREFNGTVAAAYKDYLSAKSAERAALGAYYPSITPEYRYVDSRSRLAGFSTTSMSEGEAGIGANWLLLDGGQRQYAYARAQNLAEAAKLGSLWTLRQILFSVTSQYCDALRAQELQRVADQEVVRTRQILDAVKARVEVGDVARKEILQAEADLANAVVQQLTAGNQVRTTEASLKATIGWPTETPLPSLQPVENVEMRPEDVALASLIAQGISTRPDLEQSRRQQRAGRYNVLTAERNASVDWTLNFNYSRSWDGEGDDGFNRSLTFLISFPLFDGGISRENARQSKLSFEAGNLRLEQQFREARSEIEAAFLTWKQNRERLVASEAALRAARLNFQAASESQAAGAGSILEVTNARSALITAETNFVQAFYDYFISDVQLRLVTGEAMPGESR
jgi:outer membrane protein